MSAPTALYRRYRPDSFATVIGQEHVTAPLMTALDKDRVNHAYLFSGPRGCGKTTSARILARCLNCAQGPTSHPCGTCDSCVELARGGSGSLDVIEIDAASHGGVDDARDLRERATFAPIRDRYKIFIIDEAHMVTSAGFNALLKIVEEPPEHIKFIFATTEPDKVIGTIRSRTHHYPFRLVPPEPLMAYLAQLCEAEAVSVAPGVLSLVVRAGGGSVRDSLSVLDQLMAGAGASGLDYDLAVDLLGYTHSSLLDDVVEALAASDSATVFRSVDRVIQTGHDPRRFVEDLLERFRDLIIVHAMPESAHAILRGTPEELIARMQTQAAQLGAAELSRAADVTNAAFNEMTGATSPRLHLELLGARLLLPGADSSARGMATRLDQLERRFNYGGTPAAPAQGTTPSPAHGVPAQGVPAQSVTGTFEAEPAGPGGLAAVRAQLARAKEAAGAEVAARHAPDAAQPPAPAGAQPQTPITADAPPPRQGAETAAAPQRSRTWDELPTPAGTPDFESPQEPDQPPATRTAPVEQPQAAQPVQVDQAAQDETVAAAAAGVGSTGIEVIRRAWPEILTALRNIRMASWVIVTQNVVPQTFDGQELRVGLPSTGLISTFTNSGHLENLQQAINQVLGLTVQILPVDGEAPSPRASSEPNPKVPTGSPSPQREGGGGTAPRPVHAGSPRENATPTDSWGLSTAAQSDAPATAPVSAPRATPTPAKDTAPAAATPAKTAAPPAPAEPAVWDGPTEPSDPWDEPHPDSYPPADYQPESYAAAKPQDQPKVAGTHAPPYTPQVSSIAAWTTGWGVPAAEPAPVAPAEAEAPRRSAKLAEQIALQTSRQSDEPAPQDWGVSLGQASRQNIADPGWGSQSDAPDWARENSPTAVADAVEPPQNAQPPARSSAIADPAGTVPTADTIPTADTATPFNAALPVNGSPLGASRTYPTTTSVPTQETAQAPVTAQKPGTPASDLATAAPARNSDKLSMYQRLANSSAAQASRAPVAAMTAYVQDVPSPDDVTLEESGVVGQAAVERILGGVLIEERPLSPGS